MADQAPEEKTKQDQDATAGDAPSSAAVEDASADAGDVGHDASASKAIGMVVALLVVTVAVLQFINPGIEESRKAQNASNLAQIGIALSMYQQTNAGAYPEKLTALYPEFVKDPTVLVLPERQEHGPYPVFTDSVMPDYLYLPPVENGAGMVAFAKRGSPPHPDGRHVLKADGKVEWLADAQFKEAVKKELAARQLPTDAQATDALPLAEQITVQEFLKELE